MSDCICIHAKSILSLLMKQSFILPFKFLDIFYITIKNIPFVIQMSPTYAKNASVLENINNYKAEWKGNTENRSISCQTLCQTSGKLPALNQRPRSPSSPVYFTSFSSSVKSYLVHSQPCLAPARTHVHTAWG